MLTRYLTTSVPGQAGFSRVEGRAAATEPKSPMRRLVLVPVHEGAAARANLR